MEPQAYEDRPLPIGLGQTISQPLIVAMMTEALALEGSERVLEIGTGSGYQAAILAELAKEVYTIERVRELSIQARKVLYRLGFDNIKLKIGDGTLGWPEEAPYDRIIVTAGAPHVPEELMKQLADGGRLVIPVGGEDVQHLDVVIRKGAEFHTRSITACRFVKLVGKSGWHGGG
jgi:protein-L-isoaspartate(D-aspartate) O-methyltransferase